MPEVDRLQANFHLYFYDDERTMRMYMSATDAYMRLYGRIEYA
ncbi:hypothetical protein HAT93_03324 [Dickeya solani]|nr:hypothetical protein [Dickeya solani]